MKMKTLPQPLKTWLTQSILTEPVNSTCVLIVDKLSYQLINSPSCLSKIYPLVKSMYPEVLSLHVISSSISFFIKNNTIQLHTIEVIS
jgi:hypothetical protein